MATEVMMMMTTTTRPCGLCRWQHRRMYVGIGGRYLHLPRSNTRNPRRFRISPEGVSILATAI